MHPTALLNGKSFFDVYSKFFSEETTTVVDLGSQNVNGSLKDVCPENFKYIGVDFQEGNGVDIILKDPYELPFESESIDIFVASSTFEHSEFFWLIFLEVIRVLKPNGLFYMNAPSDGAVHRFPVDCWRFYPDSGKALASWANRNGYRSILLESYTQQGGKWYDYVAVFLKDGSCLSTYTDRILSNKSDFENGFMHGTNKILNQQSKTQNQRQLKLGILARLKKKYWD